MSTKTTVCIHDTLLSTDRSFTLLRSHCVRVCFVLRRRLPSTTPLQRQIHPNTQLSCLLRRLFPLLHLLSAPPLEHRMLPDHLTCLDLCEKNVLQIRLQGRGLRCQPPAHDVLESGFLKRALDTGKPLPLTAAAADVADERVESGVFRWIGVASGGDVAPLRGLGLCELEIAAWLCDTTNEYSASLISCSAYVMATYSASSPDCPWQARCAHLAQSSPGIEH